MTINYNNQSIELKFSFRADMLFESATGHSFSGSNESEWLQYMFCNIVAVTKNDGLKFDDFLEWISENPTVFYDYLEWYTEYQKSVLELRKKPDADSEESKKKVSQTKKK
jgi:hypothetical protein